MPQLAGMDAKERTRLVNETLVAESAAGHIITYRGEISDVAYFILKGSVGVGYLGEDEYVILNYLREGELFGAIAALTGLQRTANIITEEPCEFLILPSQTLQRLARRHDGLRVMFYTLMAQRLSATELPNSVTLDQEMLRELRTDQPATT
jgi:CRP-like cAMP-binding protein